MLPWVIAGALGLAAVAVVLTPRTGGATVHPEPRPGITGDKILPSFAIPNQPGAAEAYAAARTAPATLDGVYCHCDCSKHFGHRSLLTCFESDHGAFCDVCMGEATMAAQMAAQGNSLQQIRQAIDASFGATR
ncbi:MAG TPA: CYCXC family (seleno)protein [Gemmatimonadales bacterium]|nr:CYCXC family (seleno)protein [Gemmatimonadales bacterium]